MSGIGKQSATSRTWPWCPAEAEIKWYETTDYPLIL